jgi:hypothetical protein
MIIRRDHVVLWQHCGNVRSGQLLTLSAASQQKASVPTGRGWRSTCPIACSITAGANRRTNRMESHSANLREIKGGSLLAKRPVCVPSAATALIARQSKGDLANRLSRKLAQVLDQVDIMATMRRPCQCCAELPPKMCCGRMCFVW